MLDSLLHLDVAADVSTVLGTFASFLSCYYVR